MGEQNKGSVEPKHDLEVQCVTEVENFLMTSGISLLESISKNHNDYL